MLAYDLYTHLSLKSMHTAMYAVDIIGSECQPVSQRLEKVAALLGGHGVGVLYDKDGCTPIAEYINFGDTYAPTILFSLSDSLYHLTSWGDWYEEWEAQKKEEIKLEYIGSVSEGTTRADDLIPKFLDVAEEMAGKLHNEYNIGECKLYRKRYNALSDSDPEEEWDYLLDEICCLLNELSMCPDGYYFGAHPGDGSDFGYCLSFIIEV